MPGCVRLSTAWEAHNRANVLPQERRQRVSPSQGTLCQALLRKGPRFLLHSRQLPSWLDSDQTQLGPLWKSLGHHDRSAMSEKPSAYAQRKDLLNSRSQRGNILEVDITRLVQDECPPSKQPQRNPESPRWFAPGMRKPVNLPLAHRTLPHPWRGRALERGGGTGEGGKYRAREKVLGSRS